MKKKKRKKKNSRESRHHIFCSSRGGTNTPDNIIRINAKKHNDFHKLFSNLTPSEIIIYLVEYFWKGNIGYVLEALEHYEEQNITIQ